jgi:hypothetical protein
MSVSCLSLDSTLIIGAKGTGIQVYTVIDLLNLSITVDGGSQSSFVYDGLICNVPYPPTTCYNASVYNNQALTYAPHTVNITIFPYGSFVDYLVLDYAVISSSVGSTTPSSHQSQ